LQTVVESLEREPILPAKHQVVQQNGQLEER
jgi:hypothetical protein